MSLTISVFTAASIRCSRSAIPACKTKGFALASCSSTRSVGTEERRVPVPIVHVLACAIGTGRCVCYTTRALHNVAIDSIRLR